MSRHRLSSIRRFLLFLVGFTICLWLNYVAIAQPADPLQQGVERYRAGDIPGSISAWQTALTTYQKANNLIGEANVRAKLAIAFQQLGQSGAALEQWKAAIALYRKSGEFVQVGRLLTEQAQTYSRLGQHKAAIALLCGASETDQCLKSEGSALQIAQKFNDRPGEVAALSSLGEAYRQRGKYTKAIETLEASLKTTQEDNNALTYRAAVLNSLGNAYVGRATSNEQRADSARLRGAEIKASEFISTANSDSSKALGYFNSSLEIARAQNDLSSQMRTLLNLTQHDSRTRSGNAANRLPEALTLLNKLPNTSNKVYAAIDLAELQQRIASGSAISLQAQCPSRIIDDTQAEKLLQQAVTIAQSIQDSRAGSFALGNLGHLYECRKDYNKALEFTKQARLAADQKLLAKDSLYLWEWQAGRIFKARSNITEATQAYERAIATLEGEGGIRDNLLIAEQDLQFNFRDNVSPLYREFARLRFEQAESFPIASSGYQKQLDSALDAIDSLKLAELQNYFGDECIFALFDKERVDDLERTDTAVFSSIILNDRTAIVASLPTSGNRRIKKLTWISDSKKLKEDIKTFRLEIQKFYDLTDAYLAPAQNLYNSIIRPFATDLDHAKVKTLVFIQDGLLRSVPMAALHDGQGFLVQKYAIATTPGLRLTSPKPLNTQDLRTLALGVTQAATVDGEAFKPLQNVANELNQVVERSPGSKKLINDQFTRQRLEQELKQATYPIIHIATHGQFGTIPEDSFLVTGNNQKLTITQLESDIRRFSRGAEPIELLALTACQTGIGDDRATLGIAGITVQAGVRSALASLWYVDDAFTEELIARFYRNLRSSMSKAEALQAAQKTLLAQNKEIHPAQWAPFTLIGNWL